MCSKLKPNKIDLTEISSKLLFILTGFIIISLNIYPQADTSSVIKDENVIKEKLPDKRYNQHYIKVSYGAAFPLGDYSSNDISYSNSAFAKNGSEFAITFGYNFLEDFHLLLEWNGYTNKINKSNLASYFKKQFSSTLNWEVQTARWSYSNIMIGTDLSFKIKKFYLDIAFLFGYSYAIIPEMIISSSDNSVEYKTKISETTSNSVSYKFSPGLRYEIFNGLNAFLDISYLSSSHLFYPEKETTNDDYQTIRFPENIKMMNFTTSLGLGYSW